jgi:hypothetical protein
MGSVGDEGSNGTPDSGTVTTGKMGQTIYVRDVHSIMNKCAGGVCHDSTGTSGALGKFYMPDANAGYGKIVAAPTIIGSGNSAFSSIAPVLEHIQAGHKGVTYSPDDITKITNWLTQERADHMGTTPMPVVDPKEVLKTFSGCLTIADFNTALMAQKWSALAASNNQKCVNCHQGGAEGFIVNANATTMFNAISTQSAYMLKYFTVDTNVMPAKVIVNTGSFTSAGVTLAGHPRFDPLNNAGMTALKAWYDLAAAKQTAGGCGASTLTD